jgi:hypothetical protein
MKKFLLILTVVSVSNLIAQNSGNTGLSFLKFGFGARNAAMADLGNAISNDLSALHYNPARLSMSNDNEVMVNHNSWIQDVSSQMVGVKTNLFGIPFAVGFNVTNVNDIEIRTRPGEPQSKFNANYFYGSISSAYNFSDVLLVGATVKYLYEGILNDEATGLGFDFGLTYLTPIENLNFSAVVRNLGSMNALRNQETKLPTEIRVGTNYNFKLKEYRFDFIVAGEYQKYFDADNHINFGLEAIYDNIFAIRSGYQTNYETRDLSFGFGLIWGNLKFDYAYVPFKLSLGSGNIFSLAFKF